jgi:ferrous iron transport protein A
LRLSLNFFPPFILSLSGKNTMHQLVPLHCLASGIRGKVMQILGCPQQVQRVNEMGIRDGAEIEMIRGGSPCIIRAGMQTLCVRGNDLLNVLVEPGAAA